MKAQCKHCLTLSKLNIRAIFSLQKLGIKTAPFLYSADSPLHLLKL